MPVAMQSLDDLHDRNPSPLQTINRGPVFFRERTVANSKASRKPDFGGQSVHVKKGEDGNTDGNDNFMKMRSRGRHKERDSSIGARRLYSNKNETNLIDMSLQMAQRNSDGEGVDSSEPKLSVKERVQLLNTQNRDPPETSRGRHRGPRGWLKKRDQSAPPSNNRNRVFQKEQPSREKGSSARRSRSIERASDQKSRDKPLDDRLEESKLKAKHQIQSALSYSKNFLNQSEVSQIERGGSNSTHVKDDDNAGPAASRPIGEPHFNPRSRMRDARTVKNFSKSISVKRNSPPGSHVQNVLNSLRQKEHTVESTSESSLTVSEREKSEERSGVSVKRMVSFIHKGGLKDTSISRPSDVQRQKYSENKQNGQDSDQFSVFSSSQTDSVIPVKKPFKFHVTSFTKTTLDTERNHSEAELKQDFSLSQKKETDKFKEPVLENRYVPKLENEMVGPLKSESLSFDCDDKMDSGINFNLSADDVEGNLEVIASENKVTSGSEKVHQNVGTNSANVSSVSHGLQVYNLHYRSDSSSSRSKNDVIETREKDGADPEWEEIVAKSYALSSTSEIEPDATGNYKGAQTTSNSKPPLKKISSQSTYKESDNDDVFDGSMHPLDFALAVHGINEYTVPQSPDRSHASKSTPRDGVVFARRVQVTDEADGNLGVKDDDTRIESGLEKLVTYKSGNCDKSEPIYAEIKKERKPSEVAVLGKVTPLTKSSSGESKSSRKKETYSSLTTVNLKADTSQSVYTVTDVNSSHDVSVEVDVDSEEDYVKINPSYNPPLNAKNADVLILKGEDEGKIKSRQEEPVMSKIFQEETQDNPLPSPPGVQTVKVSAASPEVRRHRMKAKHYKMPSKSSVTSTGSVSYQHSSHSSASNDAGNRRRSRNKKTSVLSPALFIKPKDLPPNDITVIDPHSSVDSTKTPRSRSHSRTKSHRSNSDVSSTSASSLSQLNKFFDMMGLESDVLSSVLQPVSYEDDSVFQDMHTWRVGSSTNSSQSGGLSEGSRVSEDGVMNMKRLTKLPDQSQSIITKNARVIKWLVQCKKSHTAVR